MNGDISVVIWIVFGMTLLLLLGFGLAYNGLVNRWGERKEGYVGILVVGGVLITCLAAGLLDWLLSLASLHLNAAVLDLICFSASGFPMLVGDIHRADRMRQAAIGQARARAAEMALSTIEALDDEA